MHKFVTLIPLEFWLALLLLGGALIAFGPAGLCIAVALIVIVGAVR